MGQVHEHALGFHPADHLIAQLRQPALVYASGSPREFVVEEVRRRHHAEASVEQPVKVFNITIQGVRTLDSENAGDHRAMTFAVGRAGRRRREVQVRDDPCSEIGDLGRVDAAVDHRDRRRLRRGPQVGAGERVEVRPERGNVGRGGPHRRVLVGGRLQRRVRRDRRDVRVLRQLEQVEAREVRRHARDREELPLQLAVLGRRLDVGGDGLARVALRPLDDDVEDLARIGRRLHEQAVRHERPTGLDSPARDA